MAYTHCIASTNWPLRLYNCIYSIFIFCDIPIQYKLTTVTSLLPLTKKLHYPFYYSYMVHLWMFLHIQALNQHYHTWQASDQVTMDLAFNCKHIIYYCMDALLSVSLVRTYFSHPDYLVVQCWVCATYLSPILLTKWGHKLNSVLSSIWDGWVIHL